MDDFASDTDSDYTSYWRDWVSDLCFSRFFPSICLFVGGGFWWGFRLGRSVLGYIAQSSAAFEMPCHEERISGCSCACSDHVRSGTQGGRVSGLLASTHLVLSCGVSRAHGGCTILAQDSRPTNPDSYMYHSAPKHPSRRKYNHNKWSG
jgi:hypothetical protein